MKRATRREWMGQGARLLGTAALAGTAFGTASARANGEQKEEVSPAEDLMREHGALNRILLLYDHAVSRIDSNADFPPEVLASAAGIVRRFIEEYHEKLEENHLFPRFEKAGKLVDLVHTLKRQHAAGRMLTRQIEKGATLAGLRNSLERPKTLHALRLFVRMYRPHEAREDTVLFPALHDIVTSNEYDALGEQFEDEEHRLFGKDGFEGVVGQIADLEKKVGLYDLSQFTPRA